MTKRLKKFDIWSEGYSATGENSGAIFHGTIFASSFRMACKKMADNDLSFSKYFDKKDLTYWGCRLFQNEIEARKEFG